MEKTLFNTEYITRHWLTHGLSEDPESVYALDCAGFLRWGSRGVWKTEVIGLMLGATTPGNDAIKEGVEILTQEIRRYLLQDDHRLEGLQPLLNDRHLRTWAFVRKEMQLRLTAAMEKLERALVEVKYGAKALQAVHLGVNTYSLQYLRSDGDGSELFTPIATTRGELRRRISLDLGEVMRLLYVNINAQRSKMARETMESFSMELPKELLSYTPEQRYIIADALYHVQDRIDGEDERYISILMEQFHHLSWDTFLAFGALVKEYNGEWAMACFDWSSECA